MELRRLVEPGRHDFVALIEKVLEIIQDHDARFLTKSGADPPGNIALCVGHGDFKTASYRVAKPVPTLNIGQIAEQRTVAVSPL